MRFCARLLILLLAYAALLPAAAREALAHAGLTVEAIDFEGNRRYSAESVRQTVRSKFGQKFDRALLNEDITSPPGAGWVDRSDRTGMRQRQPGRW